MIETLFGDHRNEWKMSSAKPTCFFGLLPGDGQGFCSSRSNFEGLERHQLLGWQGASQAAFLLQLLALGLLCFGGAIDLFASAVDLFHFANRFLQGFDFVRLFEVFRFGWSFVILVTLSLAVEVSLAAAGIHVPTISRPSTSWKGCNWYPCWLSSNVAWVAWVYLLRLNPWSLKLMGLKSHRVAQKANRWPKRNEGEKDNKWYSEGKRLLHVQSALPAYEACIVQDHPQLKAWSISLLEKFIQRCDSILGLHSKFVLLGFSWVSAVSAPNRRKMR